MFLNISKSKNASMDNNASEKYRGEEKKIYQDFQEYMQEREEKEFISEEEFLSNSFLQNKYRREYASVMDYLDNLELTPGQEAMGITKESLLHEAVLDYTTITGTIKMAGDKEQENKFKDEYDLNRFIKLNPTERLNLYKDYQKSSGDNLEQDINDRLSRMIMRTEQEYRTQESELDAMFNSIQSEQKTNPNSQKKWNKRAVRKQ